MCHNKKRSATPVLSKVTVVNEKVTIKLRPTEMRRSGSGRPRKAVILRRLYSNLRSSVPTLKYRERVTKYDVVKETTNYIKQLELEVLQKLNAAQLQPLSPTAAAANSIPCPSDPSQLRDIIHLLVDLNNNKVESGN